MRTAMGFAAAGLLAALVACSTSREASQPGLMASAEAPGRVVGMRRMTEAEYRHAIADIFGSEIKVGGRFDPIVRPDHELVATGAADSTVSPSSSRTSRSTPCVLGCCGPMLMVITSVLMSGIATPNRGARSDR